MSFLFLAILKDIYISSFLGFVCPTVRYGMRTLGKLAHVVCGLHGEERGGFERQKPARPAWDADM